MTDAELAALHASCFTIDTHIDTPTASLMREGWDFAARHDYAIDGTQCDLPRMAGNVDAMVFAVYTTQAARTPGGFALARESALKVFERTHEVLHANAAQCGLALTADDGLRLKAESRHAIYLSIENSYSLGLDVANVAKFHRLGVRMLGLNHMLNNDVADSSTDPRGAEWGGLSPFGREVVRECNRLGVVLDGSHASDAAVWDLLAASKTPVVLSHSSCRAVCDHPRNIGDELLRALATQGGVLQMNALPIALVPSKDTGVTAVIAEFLMRLKDVELTPEVRAKLSGEWKRIDAAYPSPAATFEHYVEHLLHAIAVAGVDHVGIGCDFDGGGGTEGLRDVTAYPAITRRLVEAGFNAEDIAKIWGGNTLRVLRAAEAHAAG